MRVRMQTHCIPHNFLVYGKVESGSIETSRVVWPRLRGKDSDEASPSNFALWLLENRLPKLFTS